jgi:general secretion pathway protein L
MTTRKQPLLCLEIHEETVTAALLRPSASGPELLKAADVERSGRSLVASLAELMGRLGVTAAMPCRVILGGEYCSFRTVSLPFSDAKKIAMVLPMELAEEVPVEIERLLIEAKPIASSAEGVKMLAAMIERTLLAEVVEAHKELGLLVESMGIAGFDLATFLLQSGHDTFVLLDGDQRRLTLFLAEGGEVVAMRSLAAAPVVDDRDNTDLAKEIRQTILGSGRQELLAADVVLFYNGPAPMPVAIVPWTVRPCPQAASSPNAGGQVTAEQAGRLIAVARRDLRASRRFEFCKEEFDSRPSPWAAGRGGRRRGLSAVALLLLAGGMFLAYDYFSLLAERDGLRQRVAETFAEAVPSGSRMVDPVRQLEVMIKELQGAGKPQGNLSARPSVVDLLTEISLRVPAQVPVRLVRFSAEAEVLLLRGVTGDYNTVEAMRGALQQSPLFKEVTISAATQEERGQRVSFELKLLPVL